MLTRIYGTAFPTQQELDDYINMLEEAKKRDHKKLGKELDLFVFSEAVGKGLPLLTPKGSAIRRELENFIVSEEIKRGYLHVYTPDLASLELYKNQDIIHITKNLCMHQLQLTMNNLCYVP